ncbi:type VI secretion protein IcmF/TssM N-terminal domain-containing protein [Candidatus Odyssella thessalonicensis]|uniref:type VI secretion protein IcmF/TssM N-terminal domain-containing protein n=1 Tax=Candidatus Odyssella thessalonicensis TaxID=84647 RepID=UPI000225BC5E|nr:type VI secretion protein IcmF/TssM N-terminal domain-containing protein [Candidatus Odyssella thessalonicensis]
MKTIMDFISGLNAYLHLIVISGAIIALLLMLLFLYVTSRKVQTEIDKRVPPGSAKAAEDLLPPEDKTPPWGGFFSRYLTLRGYFKVGDLSLIFLRALKLLRNRLDTVNYKYFLPWYLMIGPSSSGKSSLIERGGVALPLGKPTFGVHEDNPGLKWWFLNRGVILDIRGDLLIRSRGTEADERGWQTIVNLLARYRHRRPADGIILTIPATELYGKNKLSAEEIGDRARFISQKLIAVQNYMGLRLPVYVVITKTDAIPGFQQFCKCIPYNNRHNMIGWSSPYLPGTAYSAAWISEAFGSIKNTLTRLKLEILGQGTDELSRDGVFVFPSELMHLQKPLSIYMNHIFKITSYDESLLLRGIYFCGDSGAHLNPEQLNIMAQEDEPESVITTPIGALETSPEKSDAQTPIFFLKDILEAKIFKETGLAQPIRQRLISANKHLNYAKAGIVGFMGIGTWGILKTYDNFSQNRDYLLPVLGKVSSILYQIPATRLDQNRVTAQMFDEQTRQLLDMMDNLQKADFFSIFMPSSWFSPISDNLKTSLKVSYDQIILRTVYMDLLLKARDMLTFRVGADDYTRALADMLTPVNTVEYQLFKSYVQRFIDLSNHIDKYNRLQESADPELLKDVVQYTLGIELPKEFLKNYSSFRRVLKDVPYPKIDLNPYQGTARETLNHLYSHFINSMFSARTENSIIGKLKLITRAYGKSPKEEVPSLDPLREIARDLRQAIPHLGEPGKTWMDGDYFDAGVDFSELMGQISSFKLFGPDMVHLFAAATATGYRQFQQSMLELNNMLAPRKPMDDPKRARPSDGLINLEKSLTLLFNQSFMTEPTGEMFVSKIPETHVVFWNSKLIDFATDEVKSYEQYMEQHFDELPPGIRGTLKESIRANLQKNIVSLIAKAQTITPRPLSQSTIAAAEETLRNKIDDVKTIVPKFIKLLEVMNDGGVGTGFVELRTLLGTLSTRLLEQVDQLLEGYGLYKVKEDNFSWWNGISSPILDGYNVKDAIDLGNYLEKQRALLRRLTHEYATFMVQFLAAPILREYAGQDDLVFKWKRLIDDVDGYEKKKPGNSLQILEESLSKDLSDIDLQKCFTKIPLKDVRSGSGDYLLNRRDEMKRGIRAQCEILRRQQSISNYQRLAEYFNDNIRDKFPFLANPQPDSPEAEPDNIKEFFRIYKDLGNDPKVIYDQVYQLGAEAEDSFTFLTAMEKLKVFFESFLKSPVPAEVPTFDIEVAFRVNREREMRSNLIIDWTLTPNDTHVITNHDKSKVGQWSFGNEIQVSFRWPPMARMQPYKDPNQANMEVEEGTVTYRYPGRWSLFWMIRQQQALQSEYSALAEPTPYILKYEIPNGPEDKTLAFIRVTILSPRKGRQSGKPVRIPPFPTLAPDLPDSVLQKANQAVLTLGNQRPTEPTEDQEEPIPPTSADQATESPPAPEATASADQE